MVPYHSLIVPIEHLPSTLALSPEAVAELTSYKQAISDCFSKSNELVIYFEVNLPNLKTQHLHIQV